MSIEKLFKGLTGGVFEVTIPEKISTKKYIAGFKDYISEEGYKITKVLKDTNEKNLYHLFFQKEKN